MYLGKSIRYYDRTRNRWPVSPLGELGNGTVLPLRWEGSMNVLQLQSLVAQGESGLLEFKKTTGERRDAMHSLCAMLNHRGGQVLFGIEPQGRIAGQQVSDRTIEEIS